jgi:hypothetical protein
MTEAIASWEHKITPYVPNLAYPAFINAVRGAAIQFCTKTEIWRETLDRIDVVADEGSVDLAVPGATGGEIVGIGNVKYKENGAADDQFRNLDPYSKIQENLSSYGSWEFQTSTQPNGYYLGEDKTKLYFYKIPTVESLSGLLVEVILKPSKTCTTLPDLLWNNWDQAIADGAKARLLGQNAQPWFNPQLAGAWMNAFERKINEAKTVRYHGYNARPSQVKMREWV